ncbi:MAG TPA: nuclear transport factor 2 family protein [Candidatus Acidoferrum sp.]|nr:nuclear transport factor 2 family protein [Candidatus Acidoferrum sp.]
MRTALLACTMLVAGSLLLARQIDTKTRADENRIMLLESAWNSAAQGKNAKALDELLASAFVYTDNDGTFYDKAEYLKSIANPSSHPDQIVNESTTVYAYGNVAVVTGIHREKGSLNGKSYSRRSRFTDTWMSQNGIWQCVAGQSTLVTRQ